MQTVTKTEYPASGKIVLECEGTGIMISTEHYQDLQGLTDEQIFEELMEV